MSEWRYECPQCLGKFHEWIMDHDDKDKCPFCGLIMFSYDADSELNKKIARIREHYDNIRRAQRAVI